MFKKLNEELEKLLEYQLIKDRDDIKSDVKYTGKHNEYYNPNVGPLGSYFGKIISSSAGKRDPRVHCGIDLRYNPNEDIKSFCNGVVIGVHNQPEGYGKYIDILDHNGYSHGYCHLNTILVKVGDRITKGQLIGKAGSTGISTGTHLHYNIKHTRTSPVQESKHAILPLEYIY